MRRHTVTAPSRTRLALMAVWAAGIVLVVTVRVRPTLVYKPQISAECANPALT